MGEARQRTSLDYRSLFEELPTAYLVLTPDLVIVDANAAYRTMLGRTREELIGWPLFEAFPPAPDALDEHGNNTLELSFRHVRDTGEPDVMPLYKYDVVDKAKGTAEERYWSLINAPLLADDGSTRLLLLRVEDVTDYVREREGLRHEAEYGLEWQRRAQAVEGQLYQRMRQLEAARQEQASAVAALRASDQRARAVLDTAVDAIITIDGSGRIESVNRAAEQMFGYPASEVIGRNVSVLMPEDYAVQHDAFVGRYRRTGQPRVIGSGREVCGRRRDGSVFPAELAVSEVGAGRSLFTGVVRDITERKQLEARLTHQALHDPLTGLANRALLVERLDVALARRSEDGRLLALLFLDLDRFKLVNDTLGHEAGDELLRQTAARLQATVRPQDVVARLGGDEFVVLCEDVEDTADARSVADRVVHALSRPLTLRDREIHVSASVGVVTDAGERSSRELLRDADAAMYRAKEEGRGRVSAPDGGSHASTEDRLQLSSDLHRARGSGELRAHYQPLVDLTTGEISGAEALLRWQHPDRGLLMPGAFLPLAEDVGLMTSLDTWMLTAACTDAVTWRAALERSVGVSVNLSGRSLADRGLRDTVVAALEASGLDAELLTLEMAEGALMQNAAATVRTLSALRDLGVRLAVDDFGTGYSSLAYLQRFPVHAMKVDRSFVAPLGGEGPETEASTAIVRAIVHLAQGLGLQTVAEGIETPEQLAAVTALGCDVGQGFFLGRPTTPDNIRLAAPDGVALPSAFAAHGGP